MDQNILNRIKDQLKSEYYLANDDWLKDCMCSNKDILDFVKVQWQLSDLREVNSKNGCLPHNITQQKFTTLHGNYILQVEQMYDISMSKYKQLEQIRNSRCSETQSMKNEKKGNYQPPKKRMMQLKMTDGLHSVIGIEYSNIPKLNEMLLPGYKVMILGPVKCRKGVLLLEERNFKGIGGEVDSLLIPNALENVLAKTLNLQQNPDPYNDNDLKASDSCNDNLNSLKEEEKEKDVYVPENKLFEDGFEIDLDEISEIEDSNQTNNHRRNEIKSIEERAKPTRLPTIPKGINVRTNYSNEKLIMESLSDVPEIKQDNRTIKDENVLDDDDYLLEMIDEEQLIESTDKKLNVSKPFRVFPKEGTSLNNDVIVISEEEVREDSYRYLNTEEQGIHDLNTKSSSYVHSQVSATNGSDSTIFQAQQRTFSSLLGEKRLAIQVSAPEAIYLKKGKIERHVPKLINKPNSPEPDICEFICDIKNTAIAEVTYRTVRAHVDVHGKLSKSNSCWILEATISDGTGSMEVSFSNKVLENLLGFSVKEFSQKKKLKKANPEIEHELRMTFRKVEQELKTLDALLELEFSSDGMSKVTKITKLTKEQEDNINKKLHQLRKTK